MTSSHLACRLILAAGLMTTMLAGCSKDQCREYSKYTCAQLETKQYNVYYYDVPKATGEERSIYLGQAQGLQACGVVAWDMAGSKADEREGDWSYICCLQTSDSTCAEKHR